MGPGGDWSKPSDNSSTRGGILSHKNPLYKRGKYAIASCRACHYPCFLAWIAQHVSVFVKAYRSLLVIACLHMSHDVEWVVATWLSIENLRNPLSTVYACFCMHKLTTVVMHMHVLAPTMRCGMDLCAWWAKTIICNSHSLGYKVLYYRHTNSPPQPQVG